MGGGRDKRKKVVAARKAKAAAEELRQRDRQRQQGDSAGGGGGAAAEEQIEAREPDKKEKKSKKELSKRELEGLIADIRARDSARRTVTVEPCGPPSARLNFTLVMVNADEALLFGGEHYDGNPINTFCYNELYRLNFKHLQWSRIDSINTPPYRCSHQCVVFRDSIFMFGGEFCTSDKFHHYRDFWRLDLQTFEWEELNAKNGPSARSGHRMVVWRNNIVLFGGFYEAFREMQWFNDLYIFSIQNLTWRKVTFPLTAAQPGPRSGHQLFVYQDTLLVNGGYTRSKGSKKKSEAKVHRDMWALDLTALVETNTQPVWNRLSRKGQAPSERSGAQLAVFKHRGIHFGGVFDESDGKGGLSSASEFFNDLHAFDLQHRRWYEMPLETKVSKAVAAKRRRKLKQEDDAEQSKFIPPEDAVSGESIDEGGEGGISATGISFTGLRNDLTFNDGTVRKLSHVDSIIEETHLKALSTIDSLEDRRDQYPYEAAFAWMWDSGMLSTDADFQSFESEGAAVTVLPEGDAFAEYEDKPTVCADPHRAAADALDSPSDAGEIDEVSQDITEEGDFPYPIGRINCAMLVRNHTLIIYGGVREHKTREWALDDCWSIDLNKRDRWQCLISGNCGELDESDGDGSDESTDDQDSHEDDEEQDLSEEDGDCVGEIPEEEYEGEEAASASLSPNTKQPHRRKNKGKTKKSVGNDPRAPAGTRTGKT